MVCAAMLPSELLVPVAITVSPSERSLGLPEAVLPICVEPEK